MPSLRVVRLALSVCLLACAHAAAAAAQQEIPADVAERQLRAAITLNPEAAALRAALGEALRQQGRLPEEVEAHRAAVGLAPDSAEYRARLATVLLEAGEWERAELQFRQAIRLDSARADLYAGLGEALRRQDLHLPAREAFARAARLEPDNPEFRSLLQAVDGAGSAGLEEATGPPLRPLTAVMVALFGGVLIVAGAAMVLPVLAAVYLLLVVAPLALLRGARR